MPTQDPNQAPHIRHAAAIPFLEKHIAFLDAEAKANPNNIDAVDALTKAQATLKHTRVRLPLAEAAAKLVEGFGFTHEITKDKITANDAVGFVAKVAHETAQGVATSQYARAHKGVRGLVTKNEKGEDVIHCDEEKFVAPRDAAAEVVEHLGLTDPANVAAVKAFFATPS